MRRWGGWGEEVGRVGVRRGGWGRRWGGWVEGGKGWCEMYYAIMAPFSPKHVLLKVSPLHSIFGGCQ